MYGLSSQDSFLALELYCMIADIYNAKQKQPGCKKVRGQSEATMVIGDQKL